MRSRIFHPVCRGLFFAVVILSFGCGKDPHTTEYGEVSGKVIFQGKPLPGGDVSFIAVKGAFASSGPIEEDGSYKIKAPLGEVQIGVNNRKLAPRDPTRGPPKERLRATPRGMIKVDDQPKKGRYVPLPAAVADPATSGLRYTVKPGSQTYDIELSKVPPANPNAAPQ
jgi:hypothetical protein